jgi:hypothetical protein
MKSPVLCSLLLLAVPASAAAQLPASPVPGTEVLPALANTAAPIPVGSRVGELPSGYDEGGRRDPFSTLVAPRRTAAAAVPGARPRSGLASLALADITVRGLLKSGKTMLAILEGPNKQSFVARLNDKLLDATVQTIDTDGVVFAEQIDPSMTPNQVRKTLRPAGEELR